MQNQKTKFKVRSGETFGSFLMRVLPYTRKSFYCSISVFAVFLLALVFVPYAALEAAASNYTSANVKWGAVSLTLDPDYDVANPSDHSAIDDAGHGDVLFGELVPTANNLAESGDSYGTLKVLKKTIGIISSGKYYSVYLSTSSNNNNLNLELDGGGQNTGINIPAVSSTFSTPAGLAGTSWGYAVPGVQNTGVPDAPTGTNAFVVPALLDTQISAQTETSGASQTYTQTKWATVPTNAAPQQVWKAEAVGQNGFGVYESAQGATITGDTTNNHFDVYYAVAVDTNVLAGTYSNEIVYTAMASASSLDVVSKNLMADRNFGGYKDVATIRFDLTQSTTTISESDITIKLVPHTTMLEQNYTSETFQISDLTSAGVDTSDFLTCAVVPNSLTVSTYAEVSCIIPSQRPEEGEGESTYDFWLNVDGYNYNYISVTTENNSPVGSFIYAGLQTEFPTYTYKDPTTDNTVTVADARKATDKKVVTEMQQMTVGVCDNTNAWGNTTSANAKIYDQTGGGFELVSNVYKEVDVLDEETGEPTGETETVIDEEATIQAKAALGIGTFSLTDTRDQKQYLVRRLADGNCWMVQNLDLELSSAGVLTSADSDVSANWDPYNKVAQADFANWSLTNLGQEQPAQYLAKGQSDYWWGSKISDDGNYTELDSVANNANADIARSYANGADYIITNGLTGATNTTVQTAVHNASDYDNDNNTFYGSEHIGHYYNWHAATAETGTYAQTSGNASSSLCPKGWQLPVDGDSNTSKSWQGLLFGNYTTDGATALASNAESSSAMRQIP